MARGGLRELTFYVGLFPSRLPLPLLLLLALLLLLCLDGSPELRGNHVILERPHCGEEAYSGTCW